LTKPKNIIVQWDTPKVEIKKEFKDLGVVRANPIEYFILLKFYKLKRKFYDLKLKKKQFRYVKRFGSSLKKSAELPQFVKEIMPPEGVILADDNDESTHRYVLEGDVYALNYVDLEREGLQEYRSQLKLSRSQTMTKTSSQTSQVSSPGPLNYSILRELYDSMKIDEENKIAVKDAEKIFIRFMSRLTGSAKSVNQANLNHLFHNADPNLRIDFEQFRKTFENLILSNVG